MALQSIDTSQSGTEIVVLHADEGGRIVVPDGSQLFGGSFERNGQDLTITHDGAPDVLLPGYFATQTPADLYSDTGARLRGDLVEQLAGPLAPGQYAQTGASVRDASEAIGQVETADGAVSVQRTDGTVETLNVGTKIFQQDVIQTEEGASVSVTFVDGTIFTLASGSRMVVDELIYDPDANDNSGSFSLIQGGFVFIAGQVAKTGGMEVGTPSSTMGIRGTTVVVELGLVDGKVVSEITLARDVDGDLGRIEVFDLDGNLIANITGTDTKWFISADGEAAREVARTLQDDAEDNLLIAEAFAAFRSAITRVENGDTFVSLGDAGGQSQQGGNTGNTGTDFEVDSIDEPEGIDQLQDIETEESDDLGPFDEGLNLLDEPEVVLVTGFEDATEDSAITGDLSVVGGGGGLTFTITEAPDNGTATLNSDGSFEFVPDPNFNGQDTFSVTATDSNGNSAEGVVVVNVLPVNDAPETSDQTAGVTEDGTVIGVLSAFDVDGDALTFSLTDTPANGEVALQSNGTYSYTPDPDFAGTDSFGVRVSDPAGDFAEAVVTVTVSGENDAPFVVVTETTATDTLTDGDSDIVASGTLVADDADAGDTPEWSGGAVGVFGTFAISANGDWTYTLDPGAASALGAGDQETETFSAVATDDSGATVEQDVVITLNGTNDLPVVTSSAEDAEGAVEEGAAASQASGTLDASDPDAGPDPVWSAGPATAAYGSFDIDADGNWTYELDNAAADELAAGDTATETFEAIATDVAGTSVSQTVTVTVTGTNDDPFVVAGSTTSTGALADGSGPVTASGKLVADDPDAGDIPVWSGSADGTYGSLVIDADGNWTYTLDTDAAQELGDDDVFTETFVATATDGSDATVTQSIVITLNGNNDLPVITSSAEDAEGAVTEGDAVSGASGTLTATDADAGPVPTWSAGVVSANYGTFDIDAGGNWTYQLDNAAADELADGVTATETFEAVVTDSDGQSVSQTVSVVVTGTNDDPFVVAGETTATGSLTDGSGPETASGLLTAGDPDSGDTPEWSGSISGTYGTFVVNAGGDWTYQLDAEAARELIANQVFTETFTATATDDSNATVQQQVVITLTGTDDIPEITHDVTETVGEVDEGSETPETSGKLAATDADAGSTVEWTVVSTAAAYGSFVLLTDGSWTYTLDNAAADPLSLNETATETLLAVATDSTGQTVTETVTVTVNGTNDAPVLSRTTIFETTGDTAVDGVLTATDVDGSGTLTFALGTDGPDNGTVVINDDGSFTYTPDGGFLGVEKFEYTVDDGNGGVSTARAEIEVESDNTGGEDGVTIGLNTEADADTAAGAVEIGIEETATPVEVNLAIVLDSSGSISRQEWSSLLDSVDEAVSALKDQFSGSSTNVEVQLISFSTGTVSTEILSLDDPGLSDAIQNLEYIGRLTDWGAAFTAAGDFLLEEPLGETNYMIFATDGQPNSGTWEAALDDLQNPDDGSAPVIISAFGFGDADFDDLVLVDPDAQLLESSDMLVDAIQETPLFNPQLISLTVELEADGVDQGVIATEASDALLLEGTDYELPLASIANIVDLLGESNRISITAQFDADGDDTTAEIELFSSDVIGKADTGQTISGQGGNDLLFGSDQSDTIDGAGGDDIILAFGGDDTVIVQDTPAGTEFIDGGDGRDTLSLNAVGDLNTLLGKLDLTDIEAIDMTNGESNALELSLADVVDLSSTADASLEALLASALPESATIYGDQDIDTLELTSATGDAWIKVAGGGIADGLGNTLDIYEYTDSSGDVLATLGVDSDIVVTASDGATV